MKTHKRKPLLNAILLHYRHILVYILPLRVNIPKKFLKSDDAGYLVHRWEHRPRNKTTQLLTWVLPFTSANPRTAFERIWRAEVTLAWPTSRHSEDQTGCFMWRFFGIYKQGYKIVSLDWMERTHYIKEPKSDTQRQKKKKGTDGSCGSIPTSFLSFLYISKSFLNTINRRFGISTAPGLKYFYFGKKNTLRT